LEIQQANNNQGFGRERFLDFEIVDVTHMLINQRLKTPRTLYQDTIHPSVHTTNLSLTSNLNQSSDISQDSNLNQEIPVDLYYSTPNFKASFGHNIWGP
jgi:hypothetical protein